MVEKDKIDIFKSNLVPKHEILSQKEKEWLIKKFKITENQLPKIKESDPAVIALKARKGDIIKITRKSPTAGESLYYRLVV